MMQPSDNELDKLIKEAGDNYQPTGANPDWDKMQSLLDTHLPVKKDTSRRVFFLLVLLCLIMGLGGSVLFFYNQQEKATVPLSANKPTTPANIQHASVNPSNKVKSPSAPDKSAIKAHTDNNQSKEINFSAKKEVTGQQNKKPTVRSGNRKNKLTGKGKMKVSTQMGEADENNNQPSKPGDANETAVITENVNPFFTDTTAGDVLQIEINGTGPANKLTEIKSAPAPTPPLITAENKKLTDKKTTKGDKKNKPADKSRRPLEIALLYAPELTTIGFTNLDKPGSNYGLLVSYTIYKNISIQTGVTRSKKNYIAEGTDFKTNYMATPPYKLNSVKGYCNMYEVPLNIKYQLSHSKKINLYAVAGVSSYFMTNEFYTYQYTSANSMYRPYNWSKQYSSQKNYWFSLATIGIGFEKAVSNKLSVGAMPFAKIPFKGMGTGSLKLLSTGINFSVSYRPAFGK